MSIRHLQGAASDRLSQRRRRTSADAGHIDRQTAHPAGSSPISGSQGYRQIAKLDPQQWISMITQSEPTCMTGSARPAIITSPQVMHRQLRHLLTDIHICPVPHRQTAPEPPVITRDGSTAGRSQHRRAGIH